MENSGTLHWTNWGMLVLFQQDSSLKSRTQDFSWTCLKSLIKKLKGLEMFFSWIHKKSELWMEFDFNSLR